MPVELSDLEPGETVVIEAETQNRHPWSGVPVVYQKRDGA